MSVAVFPLGPLETNCYIVSNEGQAVAIDVGGDPAPVSKYLKEHGLELKAIASRICTLTIFMALPL